MRPDSIKKFDLFYLGSIVVGLIHGVVFREALTRQVTREFERQSEVTASLVAGSEGAIAFGFVVLSTLISLLLWYLVSRRKIGLVRWIIALLTAYNLLKLPAALGNLDSPMVLLWLVGMFLQVVAVFYLFKPETSVWLQGKRVVDADDVEVVDHE